jgi:hypothetical protein
MHEVLLHMQAVRDEVIATDWFDITTHCTASVTGPYACV